MQRSANAARLLWLRSIERELGGRWGGRMNPEHATPEEEQFAVFLEEFDDALAAGVAPPEDSLPGGIRELLGENLEYVRACAGFGRVGHPPFRLRPQSHLQVRLKAISSSACMPRAVSARSGWPMTPI